MNGEEDQGERDFGTLHNTASVKLVMNYINYRSYQYTGMGVVMGEPVMTVDIADRIAVVKVPLLKYQHAEAAIAGVRVTRTPALQTRTGYDAMNAQGPRTFWIGCLGTDLIPGNRNFSSTVAISSGQSRNTRISKRI